MQPATVVVVKEALVVGGTEDGPRMDEGVAQYQ